MATTSEATQKKKLEERAYVEEARRACSIFPEGQLAFHEEPDFLLRTDGRTLGVEVTVLCREEPRAEDSRLANVAGRAKDLYNQFRHSSSVGARLASCEPLKVTAVFSADIKSIALNVLIKGLADFVFMNRKTMGSFNWNNCEMPEGYEYIAISGADEHDGEWLIPQVSTTTVATKDLIEARIAAKLRKLPEYRKASRENWLLIVSDRSLDAGEVYVRDDDVAHWQFVFDFDKVLLFQREVDGTGQVVEVQREHRPNTRPATRCRQ